MLILVQFSLFDLRLLQLPDSVVYLLRSWPAVDDSTGFINHFGKVRENIESTHDDNVMPEDRYFIECKRNLKFEALNAGDDLCKTSSKQRRLFFDGKGGARLLIELQLHLPTKNPFTHIDKAIKYALKKKVLIKSPENGWNSVHLINLGKPFKNLFAHAVTPAASRPLQNHLVQAHQPLVQVGISKREFKQFSALSDYSSYSNEQTPNAIFYKRNDISNMHIDTIVHVNQGTSALGLANKYYFCRMAGFSANLRSFISFERSEVNLGKKSLEARKHFHQQLFGNNSSSKWKDLFQLYRQMTGNRLEYLQNHYLSTASTYDNSETDDNLKRATREIFRLIAEAKLEEALHLAEEICAESYWEAHAEIVLLQARLTSIRRRERERLMKDDEVEIKINQIRDALIKLLKEYIE